MSDRERRVRDEAYRIWDEAGRPEGEGHKHWREAERRIAAGEAEPVPPLEKPGAKKGKAIKPVVKGAGHSGLTVPVSASTKGASAEVERAKPKKSKAGVKTEPADDAAGLRKAGSQKARKGKSKD